MDINKHDSSQYEMQQRTMYHADASQNMTQQSMASAISSLDTVYSRLSPQHVEQFYHGYAVWQMRQEIAELEARQASLDQQINDNAVLMQLVQPSTLSLATLARLQSYGVEDIDLLDAMLERGDEWLDHAMQLLTQCERLNLIHDNYTEWCRHALEGAYNWLDSINESTGPLSATSSTSSVNTTSEDPRSLLQTDTALTPATSTTSLSNDETARTDTITAHTPVTFDSTPPLPEQTDSASTASGVKVANSSHTKGGVEKTDSTDEETAELLLRKLMSEGEDEPARDTTPDTMATAETTPAILDSTNVSEQPVSTPLIETATSTPPVTSPAQEVIETPPQEIGTTTSVVTDAQVEQQEQQKPQEGEVLKENATEHKMPGRGLVSRILAKVWNVS